MENTKQKEVCGLRFTAESPIVNALRSQSINEQSAHANKDEG